MSKLTQDILPRKAGRVHFQPNMNTVDMACQLMRDEQDPRREFLDSDDRPQYRTQAELIQALRSELTERFANKQVALDPVAGEVTVRLYSIADMFQEIEDREMHDIVRDYLVQEEQWKNVRFLPKAYMGDSITLVMRHDSLKRVSKKYQTMETQA